MKPPVTDQSLGDLVSASASQRYKRIWRSPGLPWLAAWLTAILLRHSGSVKVPDAPVLSVPASSRSGIGDKDNYRNPNLPLIARAVAEKQPMRCAMRASSSPSARLGWCPDRPTVYRTL